MMPRSLILAALIALASFALCGGDGVAGKAELNSPEDTKQTSDQAPDTKPAVSLSDKNNNSNSDVADTKTGNDTDSGTEVKNTSLMSKIKENKAMLMRTLYVLLGVTAVVVVYFVVRTARSRSRRNRSKKYGVISTSASDLEMTPLDQDDEDDEDMTVFDVNGIK